MEREYKKRILFVGMPDMALVVFNHLMSKGFNIVGIVPPEKTHNTFVAIENLSKNYNIPLLTYKKLDDSKFIKAVKNLNADIGLVCSFNKKLPDILLSSVKGGFINCHPSLLPKYKGGNPYSAVIINNEDYTGVTLHFMNDKFDSGDIITQVKVPVEKNETMGTLFNKLNFVIANAVEITLDKYEQENSLPSTPQPEGDFVKAPNFQPNSYETFIDWHQPAEKIETHIRALNPFIAANTIYRHLLLKIHSCEFEKRETNLPPGTVADLSNGFGISCRDGIIHVKSLQYGSFIITTGTDFIKRFSPKIGEKVG